LVTLGECRRLDPWHDIIRAAADRRVIALGDYNGRRKSRAARKVGLLAQGIVRAYASGGALRMGRSNEDENES